MNKNNIFNLSKLKNQNKKGSVLDKTYKVDCQKFRR